MKPVAIIGGTGFYEPGLLADVSERIVATPYGMATVHTGSYAGTPLVFVARHGADHSLPPHRVNYRANIWALYEMGVQSVFATAASGSLTPQIPPGSLCLCDQFLDFTRSRVSTFFEGGEWGVRHVDMTSPYCPRLRTVLAASAAEEGIALGTGATYVCTEGPRFETPAEIRAYAQLGGQLVGMTGVPEVVLAREAGMCYASVAIATNSAAGLAGHPLTHAEVVEAMAAAVARVRGLILRAAVAVADVNCTECAGSLLPVREGA